MSASNAVKDSFEIDLSEVFAEPPVSRGNAIAYSSPELYVNSSSRNTLQDTAIQEANREKQVF